jgi:predicted PurR-regulated permease PerM
MAVLLYIPLSILQIPYALVIAIASGVLELIPILGPWSAAIIAMLVALFQPEVPFGLTNLGLAGLIGIIYFALRQIEDSFIIPNIMGHLVRLHPAVVIFAVLAGGSIAGGLGLLLSIPTAAVVRIMLSYLYRKLVDNDDLPGSPSSALPQTTEASSRVSPGAGREVALE